MIAESGSYSKLKDDTEFRQQVTEQGDLCSWCVLEWRHKHLRLFLSCREPKKQGFGAACKNPEKAFVRAIPFQYHRIHVHENIQELMKRIGALVLMFLIGVPIAFAQTPPAQVRISMERPYVFADQVFLVDIRITNTGTTDLKPIDSMFCQFQEQWIIDNSRIVSNRALPPGACPDRSLPNGSILASARYVVLKPGQDHTDGMDLYLPKGTDMTSPLTLRLGYKDQPDSEIIWSNAISIAIKQDEPFSVKINASAAKRSLKASETLPVSVQIYNQSNDAIDIGTEICGVPGVIQWKTDNPSIFAMGGSGGCLKNDFPPREVILEPRQTYREDLTVSVTNNGLKPRHVTFRVGLQNVGHQPAWSNQLAIEILPQH